MRSATRKKIGKDPAYLDWIRSLACAVCFCYRSNRIRHTQSSITEAAHVGDRGLSQKCKDREAIPLCMEHHREGEFSAHRMGRRFWEHHGLDKNELIAALNAAYEER